MCVRNADRLLWRIEVSVSGNGRAASQWSTYKWDQVGIIQGLRMSGKDVDDRKISIILYGNIKAETKTRAIEYGVLFS